MYLARIEEFFSRQRKQGLVLSPKDWQLAQKWQEEGIPLAVVLRGIKRTCEQADSSTEIRSLAYCEPEIKRLWSEYIKQREGAHFDEAGGTYGADRLSELQRSLTACLSEVDSVEFAGSLKRIQELTAKAEGADIDGELRRIAKDLTGELRRVVTPEELIEIETRAKERLKSYQAKMSETAYRETLNSVINGQLLKKFNLEPFSFYVD